MSWFGALLGRLRGIPGRLGSLFGRLREALRSDGDDEDRSDGGGSIWNATTRGQSTGRLAEAGGLTVAEQSDEIRDVEEQAEEYRDARR